MSSVFRVGRIRLRILEVVLLSGSGVETVLPWWVTVWSGKVREIVWPLGVQLCARYFARAELKATSRCAQIMGIATLAQVLQTKLIEVRNMTSPVWHSHLSRPYLIISIKSSVASEWILVIGMVVVLVVGEGGLWIAIGSAETGGFSSEMSGSGMMKNVFRYQTEPMGKDFGDLLKRTGHELSP